MPVNWRLRNTVFQLLAAVYAEFGDEAFKGRYISIAQYFGHDASYDAVKSFFAKEVSKAADQLKSSNAGHRGSGRGAPSRSSAGPSRRPPHLYFDDEDISILTQREVEAVEARFAQVLRAPAKRPRLIKASPEPSVEREVLRASTVLSQQVGEPSLVEAPHPGPTIINTNNAAQLRSTIQSDGYQTAPESHGPSRKRPFSEIQDSIEPDEGLTHASSTPATSEQFGYVTNQGQYRCALCLSQLPNQEDLDRHEQVSKEHIRNLGVTQKVAKARQKLAQIRTVPCAGQHHNTPAPLQRRSPSVILRQTNDESFHGNRSSPRRSRADIPEGQRNTINDTLSSSIQRPASLVNSDSSQQNASHATFKEVSQLDTPQILDKGKARATSLASPLPGPSASTRIYAGQQVLPRTPSVPLVVPDTRPTTARTEIGTLYTPQTVKNAFTVPATQASPDLQQQKSTGNPPAFSATEIADIMRSTELIVQLMGCVQREAKAVAETQSGDDSFDSGVVLESNDVSTVPDSETLHGSSMLSDRQDDHRQSARQPISAPGIDVYTKMRRECARVDHKDNGKGKRKDTGSDVSFIVLE